MKTKLKTGVIWNNRLEWILLMCSLAFMQSDPLDGLGLISIVDSVLESLKIDINISVQNLVI